MVHREPSSNVTRLRMRDGDHYGDLPDEESDSIPDAAIGWLLWHMEWWWANAVAGARGGARQDPGSVTWSGSLSASRQRLTVLHDEWQEIVTKTELDAMCLAPWPTPQPLATIAAWVNVELMKNVAEIGQLLRLYGNQSHRTEMP